MANILIVDSDGYRRVHFEVAAQRIGHRTYSAGTAEEAMRQAGIYVPDLIVVSGPPSGGTVKDFITRLRESTNHLVGQTPVLTTDAALAGDQLVTVASANNLLSHIESALHEAQTSFERAAESKPDGAMTH